MKERHLHLEKASSRTFDIAVIGGGLTAAAFAERSAAKGFEVLFIETNDLASGSAGKGRQFIHGDFESILEPQQSAGRKQADEMSVLKKMAPHLIKEISFVIPSKDEDLLSHFRSKIETAVSGILSGKASGSNSVQLNRQKLSELLPSIKNQNYSGGLLTKAAFTDQARLILAFLKAAETNGAGILNYASLLTQNREENGLNKLTFRDRYTGKEFEIRCRICVEAGGSRSCDSASFPGETENPADSLIKLSLIVLPGSCIETRSAFLLRGIDNRPVAVLPWQQVVLVGSVSAYRGEYLDEHLNSDEIEYLLKTLNVSLKGLRLGASDLLSSFSVVPGLNETDVNENKNSADSKSENDDLIRISGESPVFSLQSVDRLMNRVEKLLAEKLKVKTRGASRLLGGWSSPEEFPSESAAIEIKGKRLGIAPASIEHLIFNYGSEAEHIIDLTEKEPSLNRRICPDYPPIAGEIAFAAVSEMALCLQDFFFRRTRLAMLNEKQSMEAAPAAAELMGTLLGWDARRRRAELTAMESLLVLNTEEAGSHP